MSYNDTELSQIYDYLYKNIDSDGRLYSFGIRRLPFFVDYIKKYLPKGSSVLDIGCGRGALLRILKAHGYTAYGTEIAQCLFDEGGDLYGLPVKRLFCSELGEMESNSYDCVVSNDVIEHLSGDDEVEQAVMDMARISKKYILISTGGQRAGRCVFNIELPFNIHQVVKPRDWWVDLMNKYFHVDSVIEATGSLFICGKKYENRNT